MAKVYEGSAADNANDRKAAKALGMKQDEWEGSAADAAADAKGQQAMNRAAANKAAPAVPAQSPPQGVQPHHFAHCKPLS